MIDMETEYVFREGTLVQLNENSLEITSGIWNYYSVNIDFAPQWKPLMQFIVNLGLKEGVSLKKLHNEFELDESDLESLKDLLDQLYNEGLLLDKKIANLRTSAVLSLLGLGDVQIKALLGEKLSKYPKIALIATDTFTKEMISKLNYDKFMDISILSEEQTSNLKKNDLSFNLTAVEVSKALREFEYFKDYDVITVIANYPHPILLRNLNRISLKFNKPFVFGALDGPFLLLASFIPFETSCFECFETRIKAQLRHLKEYTDFVETLKSIEPQQKVFDSVPLLHLLMSLTLNETLVLGNTGFGYFVGRLLSLYLPLFEVQIQDILRIPTCPACGYTNSAKMKELYFDFRKVVTDIAKKLEE